MTSTDENKAVVRAYVAAMNAGDTETLRTLFTSDAEIQGVKGRGSFDFAARIWSNLHSGLNMLLDIEQMAAEGDIVAVRFRESGRWTGPFLDFTQPSGRSYELVAMEWFEFRDGKIARRWGARDGSSQAAQLGFPQAAAHPVCPAAKVA